MKPFTIDNRLKPIRQDHKILKKLTGDLLKRFPDELTNFTLNEEYPVTISRMEPPEPICGCRTLSSLNTWHMYIKPLKLTLKGVTIDRTDVKLYLEPDDEEDAKLLSQLINTEAEEEPHLFLTVAQLCCKQEPLKEKEEALLQTINEHVQHGMLLTFMELDILPVEVPADRL